jgi:hypothetical protein
MSSSRRVLVGFAATVVALSSLSLLAPSAMASPKKISCANVPPATINAALGTSVTKPTVVKNGPVTVCKFPQGAFTSKVLIRFQSNTTAKNFKYAISQMTAHGEPVAPLSGYGSKAYSSTIGSGAYVDNTVIFLKGSNEVLVTAIAPLASIEQLATSILPTV